MYEPFISQIAHILLLISFRAGENPDVFSNPNPTPFTPFNDDGSATIAIAVDSIYEADEVLLYKLEVELGGNAQLDSQCDGVCFLIIAILDDDGKMSAGSHGSLFCIILHS